jgi:predicted helicase
MSQLLVQQYLNHLAALRKVSGTTRESVVREAFKDLLKGWGRAHDLVFVPEHEIAAPTKERRYVDGALMHTLRVPFGYWEAKDTEDDLDVAIAKKFRAGYPKTNIIFENSHEAVLFQHGREIMRALVEDVAALEKLLKLFFEYERPEIEAFRRAVEQFSLDLPQVLAALRLMIESEYAKDQKFRKAAHQFLEHIKEAVNPSLAEADVREMLIQHILTGEVFAAVFPGTSYHEDNNVARELHKLEATFFTGNTRFQTLKGLEPYYAAIRKAASEIQTHSEKQTFLKAIYENFYKVYNPKAADRLGVVYTPNEIVRFMIEGADWLCEKHFGRNLIDRDVEILDPAVGTGTFICELLAHFSGQKNKLLAKYQNELHANEVAILPYYVANLNIEATYAAITGDYREYPNLCFVDTLDNTYGLRKHRGHMDDLFGSVSDVNVQRIRNQNSKHISVIIGNPPYNANQFNENENNKNREYPEIDQRIKDTYIEASTAQKTKVYDMYARFFRWATDRLDENAILAFITNRSFIDSRTFDGFREVVTKEFNDIRIVDLGGDVRANPKLSGTTHNVFGIQTGVAISFMVRRAKQKGCRLYYARRPEMETAEEKLAFLGSAKVDSVPFEEVRPDSKNNWIRQADTDFDSLLPVATKETKLAKSAAKERAIFRLFSLGVVTNRDEWVYDDSADSLERKVRYLISAYNADVRRVAGIRDREKVVAMLDTSIKWTRAVKNDLLKGLKYSFDREAIQRSFYRPFVKRQLYLDRHLNEMLYQVPQLFGPSVGPNVAFGFSAEERVPFGVIAFSDIPNKDLFMPSAAQVLALYRYEAGKRIDNVTEWGLAQFAKRYATGRGKKARAITKGAIFHYVYAVLHDPVYREKYALNLKREFPRVPLYDEFWRWSEWGAELVEMHVGYESAEPAALRRIDARDEKSRRAGQAPRCILKADLEAGVILVDAETSLREVPEEAWDYRLGNRSALEWVLDQYKEYTPRDRTIREQFSTYRFADHKEAVIDLLRRVTTVSVSTMKIVDQMAKASR